MATSSTSAPQQIVISVDLKKTIQEHLSTIQEYNNHPEYLQKQAREYAIYRYETFWLPLLAENSNIDLVPPLDIYFVWVCHMFAPVSYMHDCERICGRILPSVASERNSQVIRFTEQLWTKKYGRAMPYELNYNGNIQVIPPYKSKIKYPLSQAIEEQASFYYNVSLGHYKDEKFIDDSITRYKKILYLKRLHPSILIVPMYDIDLVWRAHQLYPEIYRSDMMTNVQQVIQHDYSLNDRISNAKVISADHETRHKWLELYGDRLPKNGCMYRGKSSKGFYQTWTKLENLLESQRYSILVQILGQNRATGATSRVDDSNYKGKQTKRGKTSNGLPSSKYNNNDELPQQVFAQINSSDQEIFLRGSSGHIESHFEADFEDFKEELFLKIQQKAGFWPFNYFSTLVEIPIPTAKTLSVVEYEHTLVAENHTTDGNDPSSLYHLLDYPITANSPLRSLYSQAQRLVVGVPIENANTIKVLLETSEYGTITLDSNYQKELGTTFLFNLENVPIQQALHKIVSAYQNDSILLDIRHSIINDVHVFTAADDGSIFASAHTLNWSQLPLPSQVQNNQGTPVVTLDSDREEALIIKDNNGDWGIVKFGYDLFTDPFTEDNYQEVPYISLNHILPNGDIDEEIIYIEWKKGKWSIASENFSIDMYERLISFKRSQIAAAAQYLCLGTSLMIRFDEIFYEIFGAPDETENFEAAEEEEQELEEEEEKETQPRNFNGQNYPLANDSGKIINNPSHASKEPYSSPTNGTKTTSKRAVRPDHYTTNV